MSDSSQGEGWWQASDGKWYPPLDNAGSGLPTARDSSEPSPVTWAPITTTGPLVLAQSEYEYAVYDQQHTYGRWPKTEEGYRFATETYSAHAQSLAHGVAYTATGYQDPARLGLPTDPAIKSQTYSAPFSLIGSARRIGGWAAKTGQRSPGYSVLAWVLASIAILVAWAFVLVWYSIIFGLFGIFVIPYRLIRRSQRKSLHVQRTTLATQQAMYQQMTTMQQQMQQPPIVGSGQYPSGAVLPAVGPASGSSPPLPPVRG